MTSLSWTGNPVRRSAQRKVIFRQTAIRRPAQRRMSDRHQAAGLQEAGIALEGLRHDLPGVFTDMLLLFPG